jgi:hypothetical protein
VVDAVVRLIEVPAGQRPLRTLIGPVATSLQPVNDAADRAQREILTSKGMGHLLSVASARP